ncbi:MAG: gliding motility protein GldM [Mangrovibacterium sp.]
MGATNCPETPRQKMIGMMYLVLMAMMAMNVSVEVLIAFRVVNSSLVQAYEAVDTKGDQQYEALVAAYEMNKEKVKPWLDQADEVRKQIEELQKFILDTKEELVLKGGGMKTKDIEGFVASEERSYITNYDKDSLQVGKEDDLNVPSDVMLRLGKATELRNMIGALKEDLLKRVPAESIIAHNIKISLDTPDPHGSAGGHGDGAATWETANFAHQPMIAALTILSKIQIDISNTELSMLTWLYGQIDAGSYKFNKLNPVVIPRSTAVLQGGTYYAEVFLAAEDTTQQPQVIVAGNELPLKAGKGIYEMSATKPGSYKWNGEIKFKTSDGEMLSFPFEQEYQVVQPSATISPTKMNVFYMNIANPISVSVPGVTSKDVKISMTNGNIQEQNGELVVYPTAEDLTGKKTEIIVDVNLNGKITRVATMSFRVKKVPDPVAQIAGQSGGVVRKESLVAEQGMFAELLDFDFDLKFKIAGFDVTMVGNGGYNVTYKSDGPYFTKEMKAAISSQQPSSVIYFDNIIAKGDDKSTRTLSPISFKIQ